jgi:hypothetical protein
MKLATGPPFDDEHGTGANRTVQLGRDLRVSSTALYTKQDTAAGEHTDTPAVGEQSEWRMRTEPLGRTWIRNRRRNSSEETSVAGVFKHALYAHAAMCPAHTTLSVTGQDFTAVFKNNFMAFFVPIVASNSTCNLHTRIEIPQTSPHPTKTLAAQFQRPYRNCPDHTDLSSPHFCFGEVSIGSIVYQDYSGGITFTWVSSPSEHKAMLVIFPCVCKAELSSNLGQRFLRNFFEPLRRTRRLKTLVLKQNVGALFFNYGLRKNCMPRVPSALRLNPVMRPFASFRK